VSSTRRGTSSAPAAADEGRLPEEREPRHPRRRLRLRLPERRQGEVLHHHARNEGARRGEEVGCSRRRSKRPGVPGGAAVSAGRVCYFPTTFTTAVEPGTLSPSIGSKRPPRHPARNFSERALKSIRFSGRANRAFIRVDDVGDRALVLLDRLDDLLGLLHVDARSFAPADQEGPHDLVGLEEGRRVPDQLGVLGSSTFPSGRRTWSGSASSRADGGDERLEIRRPDDVDRAGERLRRERNRRERRVAPYEPP